VYEETLTGRPHGTSVQKADSDNKMWMQFNVMLMANVSVAGWKFSIGLQRNSRVIKA